MNFAEEIWKKQINEHFERVINIYKPRKRVKHYKIKRFMNKVFRTKFKLYEEEENTMKFIEVTRPCIKN